MAANLLGSRLRRYKGLVALISALILFIIAIVAARTYIDTTIVQRETFARATTLNLVDMLDRFGATDQQLRDDSYDFLLILRDGGWLATAYGPAWDYPPIRSSVMRADIEKAVKAYEEEDWATYQTAFADFDRTYGELIQGRQSILIGVQYVSAVIMFLGLLGVLGLLFFRLGKADDEAAEARRENENILAATKEGVFLIDSHYQIGEQKSKAVGNLFGQNIDVKGDFIELIRPMVGKEELTRTVKFLKLVFGGRVKPKLMGDLNPLHNVAINIDKRVGGSIRRVLNFDFSRDEQQNSVDELLVTVSDITNEAVLREELETIQSVQEQRLNLLKGVLHVEAGTLNDFFNRARDAYTQINRHLEEGESDEETNQAKLEKVARTAHRLKGDAAALRLDLFSSSLHQFENTIDSLRKQSSVDGQSLVKLVVQLKNMIAELELAASLTTQFGVTALQSSEANATQGVPQSQSSGQSATQSNSKAEAFTHKLTDLVSAVADREAKHVNFSVSGARHIEEHPELAGGIYDISVQLVRNAVTHGIELPEVRAKNDKPEYGKLEVALSQRAGELSLTVLDDGQGLQYDEIRKKAIAAEILDAQEAVDERALLKVLFAHGFSSRDNPGEDAGRGIGLDAVKDIIDDLGGRISVGTSEGKFTRFTVKFAIDVAV